MIVFLILSVILTSTGCRPAEIPETETETTIAQSTDSTQGQETAREAEKKNSTTTTAEATAESPEPSETAEYIPDEISGLIGKADDYYSDKEFGLAKNTYRKAEIAIEESELSDQLKQDLLDSFKARYEKSRNIVETAMAHYANARQLEYEQQYEAALEELEAAISIYPKYAEALEAYENLKAIMGLQ